MRFQPGLYGAASLTEVSFIDSIGTETTTITAPSSINKGDLLIFLDQARSSGSAPSSVTPTGFTLFDSYVSGSAVRANFWHKIADGTEDGAIINGMSGNIYNRKILMQFRGNVGIKAIAQFSRDQVETNINPSAQVVTASGGVVPLIVFGVYSSFVNVSPRTMSPAKDGEENSVNNTGSGARLWAAWKIYNASPADVTVDMDDEDIFNGLWSFYLQIL